MDGVTRALLRIIATEFPTDWDLQMAAGELSESDRNALRDRFGDTPLSALLEAS